MCGPGFLRKCKMPFEILSVAENGGDSNSIAAVQKQNSWHPGISSPEDKLFLKIDVKRNLTIKFTRGDTLQNTIQFAGLDIDSLILYLQDVREFISEEEMIQTLKGKVASQR